ncbi:MAG: ABC transporter ATP-binding protein [bacterium]
MNAVVELKDVAKSFRVGFRRKRVDAVRHVEFDVKEGEIFGLIGPNGAGKTTTIKMITGLVTPDQGVVRVHGLPTQDIQSRADLGYLPENPYFYEHLTAREMLRFYGQLFGLGGDLLKKRIDDLVERVGLGHAADRQLKRYSKGMRQRAGIAQALINDPKLVILDEPQSGLDPVGRKEVRDLIFGLRDEGKTVLFASHILPDVEAICDRVAVLHLGLIRGVGTLQELTKDTTTRYEIRVTGWKPGDLENAHVLNETASETLVEVTTTDARDMVLRQALDCGATIHSVTPHKESLEDIFIRETKAAS